MQRRREQDLQLPVVMLIDDGFCRFAAFWEESAFLDLVEGNVETCAG